MCKIIIAVVYIVITRNVYNKKLFADTLDIVSILDPQFKEKEEISSDEAVSILFRIYTNKDPKITQELYQKVENNEPLTDDESFDHLFYILIAHYIETLDKTIYSKKDIQDIIEKNDIIETMEKYYEENDIALGLDDSDKKPNEQDYVVDNEL